MTTDPTNPKPRRRWFRFSLRTLLVFMAVAGLALGWWVNSVQRQKRAIAGIKKNGGYVLTFAEAEPKKSKVKDWIRKHATAWLGQNADDIFGFDLFCYSCVVCPPRTSTSNADLVLLQCRELSNLIQIDSHETNVSDLGLLHLKGLRNLQTLRLSGCENITDASIPVLPEMKSLGTLVLHGTKVTKASLPILATMKNLRVLSLPDMQFTEDERETLRKAFPNTKIYVGSQAIPL